MWPMAASKRHLVAVRAAHPLKQRGLAIETDLGPVFHETAQILGLSPTTLFGLMLEDFIAKHPGLSPVYSDRPIREEVAAHELLLDELESSVRLANVLEGAGFEIIGDVVRSPHDAIRGVKGMTDKLMKELQALLSAKGISWPEAGR